MGKPGLVKVSNHVPKTPYTYRRGWSRLANKRPRRRVAGLHIKTFDVDLTTFRQARRQILAFSQKELGPNFIVAKHSIWPRSYGFEYMIHLVDKESLDG